jgi:hypothetical protein
MGQNNIIIKDVFIAAQTDKAYKIVVKSTQDFYQEHFFWAPKNQVKGNPTLHNKQNLIITEWFWSKIKDSLRKTGIPINYIHEYSNGFDSVEKTLEPTMTPPTVPAAWQLSEAKKLLKNLALVVFKNPTDLEKTLENILVIKDNQVILQLPASVMQHNQTAAEDVKSDLIQETLEEFFKLEEGKKNMDDYYNSKGKFIIEDELIDFDKEFGQAEPQTEKLFKKIFGKF